MTQLLIVGTTILDIGPFTQTDAQITSADAVYPLNAIPGYSLQDVTLPAGFTSARYRWVDGALAAAPPDPLVLADAQAAQTALVSAACNAAIVAGFSSSALGVAYTYPAKPTDQQNLTASVLASLLPGVPDTWTTPFWCEDATGNWAYEMHNAAQIQQVGQDGKADILTKLTKNQTLAAQIAAATTLAAVAAIIWS